MQENKKNNINGSVSWLFHGSKETDGARFINTVITSSTGESEGIYSNILVLGWNAG